MNNKTAYALVVVCTLMLGLVTLTIEIFAGFLATGSMIDKILDRFLLVNCGLALGQIVFRGRLRDLWKTYLIFIILESVFSAVRGLSISLVGFFLSYIFGLGLTFLYEAFQFQPKTTHTAN